MRFNLGQNYKKLHKAIYHKKKKLNFLTIFYFLYAIICFTTALNLKYHFIFMSF